jgi:hypothetical protein
MPACRQCGKDNPEGTVFCGYCATPLAKPAGNPSSPLSKPSGNPVSSPLTRGAAPPIRPAPQPQPNPFKPEVRSPIIHTAPPLPPPPIGGDKGRGGFEFLPWSELSSGQRAGRAVAGVIVLFLLFFFFRGMLRGLGSGLTGSHESAPAVEGSGVPITEGDRKDGIESLCKVFQIYGLPKSDHDATEAARNAAELFKLAGNQSPERSAYILTSIVGDFRNGKLGQADCSEAGAPLPTNEENTDNSAPDVQRDSGRP